MIPDARHEPDPLALLGHELRTPLNAVLGYADAMRLEAFGPLPEPYRDQAETIHAAASHLLALVDAMAGAGAAGPGERPLCLRRLDPAALERLVTDAVRLLAPRARASGLTLRIGVSRAPEIRADPLALTQILINLIDNAVKFAQPGSVIGVRLDGVDGALRLTVENSGAARVADAGLGSGQGLRLAHALSGAMGGSVTLDLPSGGGATAVVRLPSITAP